MKTQQLIKYMFGLLLGGGLIFGGTSLQAQTMVCATDSVELQAGTFTGTIQWQSSTDNVNFGNITGANTPSHVVLPASKTWYRAQIVDGTCDPVYSDTAEVIPTAQPIITVNGPMTFCPGDSTELMAPSGTGYLWSNGETTQNIIVYASGSYSVAVSDTNGCTVSSDTVMISVINVTADAGADTTLNCGDSLMLGGSPTATGGTAPYTYLWGPDRGLSSTTAANPMLYPICAGAYWVTVTDTSGCMDSDTINITTTGTPPADSVTVTYTGTIVDWVVPACVTNVRIKAWGAQGGNSTWSTFRAGGNGAFMSGDFVVCPGDTLKILVGQQGESAAIGGGGGGTFVATSGNIPLCVAGGGGGASSDQNGVAAVITQNGTMDSQNIIAGGSAGNGGSACTGSQNNGGGGGGFLTDGQDAQPSSGLNWGRGGAAFVNGGQGGIPGRGDGACTQDPYGGFGGGGSATCNTVGGGGGGGYSGGAGGPHISNCGASPRAGGGGGGSFNAGSNQVNSPGVNTGNGQVIISW